MVVPNPKAWLHDLRFEDRDNRTSIGILAFEAAAAMTRLISLHRSLSDHSILKLRSESMRSQGVAYLNSTDQHLLIRLACADMMDDLDRTAAAVSRFAKHCQLEFPRGFDKFYSDLKSGSADPALLSKSMEKPLHRMEKYVSATEKLCEEIEVLAELEASERKLQERWNRYSGPIPLQKPPLPQQQQNHEEILGELKSQRQKVKKLKEASLWNQAFDKVVVLMTRATAAVFARICVVFASFVEGLPMIVSGRVNKSRIYSLFPGKHSSGPLERAVAKEMIIRNSCPIFGANKETPDWKKTMELSPSTVGGSGLALRYATVILLAERVMLMRSGSGEDYDRREEQSAREELYKLLPAGMTAVVKGKLRKWWRDDPGPLDGGMAAGWMEAAAGIMEWLGPVARNTVTWQAERNMDRRQRFDPRPRVLMLQTLHVSDREKTEAAIAEVLVALSCACCYDERSRGASLRL